MKRMLAPITMTVLWTQIAVSAPGEQVKSETKGGVRLEKQMSFEDLLVQGRYEFVDESVSTVEQDKVLDALLGVRTDFKDKIKASASRN